MLSIIKSNSIASLEKQLADKQSKLAQLRNQFSEVRQRADGLGDLVSSALVDEASNLQSLEGQLFAAESRLRSTQAAIAKVEGEVTTLEQKLATERDRVAREASAARLRELANSLEKSKPAAAKAARQVADVAGAIPANVTWSPMITQAFDHWVAGSVGFYEGDFIDLAVKALRTHADEILAGRRSADLGKSFDEQAVAYGRKPMGLKKAS
jgi:hypothetical protein